MIISINDVDINKCNSTFLKEYLSFKNENQDTILLFQIGDFFETFFEDAKIFSDITGANLGSRSVKGIGEVSQAGIPVTSVKFYIRKIIDENYKVCLCKQIKDDQNNRTYRYVDRIYTKGTILEDELLDSYENSFIFALYHDKNICHLSYADVSTGQFYKSFGEYRQVVLELEKISPNELIVPLSQKEFFKNIIPLYNTTLLEDDFFDKDKIELSIINYCKKVQKKYIPKLDRIKKYELNNFLIMDSVTRRNLELTRTRRFLKKKGSLLWLLDYTKTPMGARLLKKMLNEPFVDKNQIKKRLDAIEELINNEDLLQKFEKILEIFSDLSRLCAKISNVTIYPRDLYKLVNNANGLECISKLCSKFSSSFLKIDSAKLEKTLSFVQLVKSAIKQEPSNDLMSGNIINDNYSTELDYLKDQLNKEKSKLLKYEKKQVKQLEIPSLKIDFSRIIGYYIEIPKSMHSTVPKEYLRKQALSSCTRYTTSQLQELEDEIYKLQYRINQLEYELYCEIRKKAVDFVEIIRSLAHEIARIDAIVSLSRCAIVNKFVKPVFNSDGIKIIDGYHPALIKLGNEVVKNDTNLPNNNMIVLTGANMSGKSTYLKYNAIICLLSQIGSYIPAVSADLTIVDKIFLHQGSTDDIINNNSSFMVEMCDLKFILDNATSSSLILLDEPAKSTNAREGGAIARAFCEYLLEHIKAKTILVTHNIELTKMENNYPKQVKNHVIGNSDVSNGIINDRKIKPGVISSSMAINTAILADLPELIIQNAQKYTNV